MQRIVDLARRLVVDGDDSVHRELRREIEVLDEIDRRLAEIFESRTHDPLTGDQLNQ